MSALLRLPVPLLHLLKKTAEGQAKSAIFAAMGEDLSLKWVVVVDDDVDVYNEEEVMWAVATRMQADRGVFVGPHAMGAILDPSSRNGLTAKVGIDATAPLDGWTADAAPFQRTPCAWFGKS